MLPMSMDQFPIINKITVVLTDGERFANLTGPSTNGNIPTKEWLLEVIAGAVITAEEQGLPGLRLPTPQEFMEFVASEHGFGGISVVGGKKGWQGFTQAELDASIAKRREHRDEDDEGDDD